MTPDEITGLYFPVLDKGFVALVDYMGGDDAIVQAARNSYGKGTRKVNTDRGLIRYLMRHKHTTPLEMCELKFHMGIPMDAHRQHVRHRTASLNEYSTRYSVAIDAVAETAPDQWRLQSDSNKQGSKGFLEDPESGQHLSRREAELHRMTRDVYEERLKAGVAREQARKDLPLSTYTMMYWKMDLHNLFHYLTLRCDPHAQLEIRSYAYVLGAIAKMVAPLAFGGWVDYHFGAEHFSRMEMVALRESLQNAGQIVEDDRLTELGMSSREITEFRERLRAPKVIPNFDLDPSKAQTIEHFQSIYGLEQT